MMMYGSWSLHLSGLISSVMRALSSKLRYPEFKSWPGTVGHYSIVGCSARLKTSFELNPDTNSKQGTIHYPELLVKSRTHWAHECFHALINTE